MNPVLVVLVSTLPLLPLLPSFFWSRPEVRIEPMRVIFFVFLGLSSLRYIYLQLGTMTNYEIQIIGYSDKYLLEGQLLLALSTLGLMTGYLVSERRRRQHGPARSSGGGSFFLDPLIGPMYPIILLLALLGCMAYLNAVGLFDMIGSQSLVLRRRFETAAGVETAFGFLAIGADALITIVMIRIYLARKIDLFSIVLFLIVLVTRFAGGGRLTIVLDLLLVGFMIAFLGQAVRRRIAPIFVTLIVLASLVILVSGSIRHQKVNLGDPMGFLSPSALADSVQGTFESLIQRPYFVGPEKVELVDRTFRQQGELFWGKTFTGILWAPIPRPLWPEKPDARPGPLVAFRVYGLQVATGVPPSLPGELSMNFGLGGIFLGMALVGFMLSRLRSAADASVVPSFAPILFAIFMISIPIQMFVTDFVGGLINFLSFIVPAFLVYRALIFRNFGIAKHTRTASKGLQKTSQGLTA